MHLEEARLNKKRSKRRSDVLGVKTILINHYKMKITVVTCNSNSLNYLAQLPSWTWMEVICKVYKTVSNYKRWTQHLACRVIRPYNYRPWIINQCKASHPITQLVMSVFSNRSKSTDMLNRIQMGINIMKEEVSYLRLATCIIEMASKLSSPMVRLMVSKAQTLRAQQLTPRTTAPTKLVTSPPNPNLLATMTITKAISTFSRAIMALVE